MVYDELEELEEGLEYEEYEEDLEEGFVDEFSREDLEVGDFDALGDAAMAGDEYAEDEFLGALAGLAASALPALLPIAKKILPKVAGSVIPKVLKFGKKLLRSRSRRAVRHAPRIVKMAMRHIARRPGAVVRNPALATSILNRCTRLCLRRAPV
jgi:hypothetical protein